MTKEETQRRHERAKDDALTSNTFGRVGAQSAIIINGAAASAVLAFIGSIARYKDFEQNYISLLPISMSAYAFGVFLAAIALLAMSLAIEYYMGAWMNEGTGAKGFWWWRTGLVLVFLSLCCFLGATTHLAYRIYKLYPAKMPESRITVYHY